jgi:hypothetical protein
MNIRIPNKKNNSVAILISSLLLALDNPLDDPYSSYSTTLNDIDIAFTALFSLELACKVISFGFMYNSESDSHAYIRNPWNVLDFIVVALSIIDHSGLTS